MWNEITEHRLQFERFADDWLTRYPDPMLKLKREHTCNVLEHAGQIINEENIAGQAGRAALLAALYHDVGRFPQFARWKTFSDAHSKNHGLLGVREIKKNGFLDMESPQIRSTVLAAVGLHNRYQLPEGIPPLVRQVTHVVRDADKLDIMRIMAQYLNAPVPSEDVVLHVKDDPEGWSPGIVSTVLSGKIPSYNDLRYVNDFRMLLGTWLQDLHFRSARLYFIRSGYLESVLGGLPQKDPFTSVCACLYTLRDNILHEVQ